MTFDDGLLDDATALARADARLRHLAESGSRVRREAVAAAEVLAAAVERLGESRPRAVVAAGPDSRLLRAVLEPVCPVPFVAWPGPGLPGWAGGLDLVVVLAPVGDDVATAGAVAEAVRRGCQLVVAAPEGSLVAEHAAGRYTSLLPTQSGDQLAVAVAVLDLLDRVHLGPRTDPDVVADALDEVAVVCSPHRDLATNPAKILAIGIADSDPLLWGGTVLAARAGRRVAESVRRATGRTALAADAEQLLAVLEATAPADVFADPFADPGAELRPALVLLDDGSDEEAVTVTRDRLATAARDHGVRVETITSAADGEVARYAAMLSVGTYAAAYLSLGMGRG
ncbi:SIS domain-containing protein [Nocardioides aurantiacus]|uniref:Phosphoglucose isomerase-like protein n=1 Tax=Nocardioides aurantiacus TaxID=86796 RepID=A0A3N2CVM2_9ACTN|nr:SIS domain-containing protein [Nocardioides aurantiacus]ROR91539.1 phosphoglucose isomerase-like protein [Nocardioides aurantiacus]